MNAPFSYTLVSRTGVNDRSGLWKSFAVDGLSVAIVLVDFAVVVVTAVLTGSAYHELVYRQAGDVTSFVLIGTTVAIMLIVANVLRAEYKPVNLLRFKLNIRRTTHVWNVIFVALLSLGFLTKVSVTYSRGWLILFYVFGLLAVVAARLIAVRTASIAGELGMLGEKRIFLIGTGAEIEKFVTNDLTRSDGIRVVGCRFLTPAGEDTLPAARQAQLRRDLNEAALAIRFLEPEVILILVPWSDAETIERSVSSMMSIPGEVHIGADRLLHRFNRIQLTQLGRLWSLQLTRLPLSRIETLAKRAFDLAAAAIALVLLTPLFVAIAILIKRDSSGPVFFVQQRYGFNQKPFRIFKFRTMCVGDDDPKVRQATRDDPRVTRVGRWLRRTNLDEIPQLFNVIRGEMSLVGPRPHALAHNREYEQKIAYYARRHNVRPGITGWAQIHGLRGETDSDEKMSKRVEYDLYYIENWSLALDFIIVVATVLSRSAYRNAYYDTIRDRSGLAFGNWSIRSSRKFSGSEAGRSRRSWRPAARSRQPIP